MLYKPIVIAARFIPALKRQAENYRYWAERGDAYAQWVVGNSYIESDAAAAATWYLRAAQKGDANAQSTLGDLYREGRGVEKNPSEAAAWYEKAAVQGRAPHSREQYRLYQRKGTQPSFRRLDRIASAQCALSSMYETGEGVVPDLVKAFMWRALAAAWWKDDHDEMGYLVVKMTKEQVTEAINQTFEWRSQRKELLPNLRFIFLAVIGGLLIWGLGATVDEFMEDIRNPPPLHPFKEQRVWIELHPVICLATASYIYFISVSFPRSRNVINWLAMLYLAFQVIGLWADMFIPHLPNVRIRG